jgi:hypothetical protein
MSYLFSAMLLLATVSQATAQPAADLALINGTIWTGDRARPRAEAVACRLGRIVAVGTTSDGSSASRGAEFSRHLSDFIWVPSLPE